MRPALNIDVHMDNAGLDDSPIGKYILIITFIVPKMLTLHHITSRAGRRATQEPSRHNQGLA
jgi:hypothetical protein